MEPNSTHDAGPQDPVLDQLLSLLERELRERPERVVEFPPELFGRMNALSVGVVIDHSAPITGSVAT
jgi:hypothetical protein